MIGDGARGRPPDARVSSLSQPGQGSIKMKCAVGLSHDVGMEGDAQHQRAAVALGQKLFDRVLDHAGKCFGFLMTGDNRGDVVDLLGIRDR